jgi:hypothetical protein
VSIKSKKQEAFCLIYCRDEKEIERIAQLFKSVGEQSEGMKHYSHYLMQNKVHKEIDRLIQDMFQHTITLQGESFVDRYQ